MTNQKRNAAILTDFLPRGSENAVKQSALLSTIGGDSRTLRKCRAIDNNNGFPSLSCGRGYFRPFGTIAKRAIDRADVEMVRAYALSFITAHAETVRLCNAIVQYMDANPDKPLPERFDLSVCDRLQIPLVPTEVDG